MANESLFIFRYFSLVAPIAYLVMRSSLEDRRNFVRLILTDIAHTSFNMNLDTHWSASLDVTRFRVGLMHTPY